jgi:phage/plasmid-like protein (TIGR03299 family)
MKPLGVVSDNYTPLQNIEAFGWFDSFVQSGLATFETAGVLLGGRRVWVLAKITDGIHMVGGRDRVDEYLLLTNGHDGSTSIIGQITVIRVVCNNTLMAALSQAFQYRRSHMGNVAKKMDDMKEQMGLVRSEFAVKCEVYDAMFKKQIPTIADFKSYLEKIVPIPDAPLTQSDRAVLSWENIFRKQTARRNRITTLFTDGRGMDLARGSVWNAYNAAVEYADYELGTARVRDFANYVLHGDGAAFKARAFNEAVKLLD